MIPDPVRLPGVLNHLCRHAVLLERDVHLLGLRIRHALVHFAVDEERGRLDAIGEMSGDCRIMMLRALLVPRRA